MRSCKQIGPSLEEIAEEKDATTVAKMNIDELETPTKLGLEGSTLMLFRDGEVVATKVGALSKINFWRVNSSL